MKEETMLILKLSGQLESAFRAINQSCMEYLQNKEKTTVPSNSRPMLDKQPIFDVSDQTPLAKERPNGKIMLNGFNNELKSTSSDPGSAPLKVNHKPSSVISLQNEESNIHENLKEKKDYQSYLQRIKLEDNPKPKPFLISKLNHKEQKRPKGRPRKYKTKDHNSPFQIFFQEKRHLAAEQYPNFKHSKIRELMQQIWDGFDEETKKPFEVEHMRRKTSEWKKKQSKVVRFPEQDEIDS